MMKCWRIRRRLGESLKGIRIGQRVRDRVRSGNGVAVDVWSGLRVLEQREGVGVEWRNQRTTTSSSSMTYVWYFVHIRTFPSLHSTPSAIRKSRGHAPSRPLQNSCRSHSPDTWRHGVASDFGKQVVRSQHSPEPQVAPDASLHSPAKQHLLVAQNFTGPQSHFSPRLQNTVSAVRTADGAAGWGLVCQALANSAS